MKNDKIWVRKKRGEVRQGKEELCAERTRRPSRATSAMNWIRILQIAPQKVVKGTRAYQHAPVRSGVPISKTRDLAVSLRLI